VPSPRCPSYHLWSAQVHITHVEEGKILVTWVVPSRQKTKSAVIYSTEPGKYSHEALGDSETYGYTFSYKSGRIHHVTLGDKELLLPNTTYYYRVGDPNAKISKELSFKTLPTPGPDVPLKFVVIGEFLVGRAEEGCRRLKSSKALFAIGCLKVM
jgi:hypothetical protein